MSTCALRLIRGRQSHPAAHRRAHLGDDTFDSNRLALELPARSSRRAIGVALSSVTPVPNLSSAAAVPASMNDRQRTAQGIVYRGISILQLTSIIRGSPQTPDRGSAPDDRYGLLAAVSARRAVCVQT